jgi:hypothetical protein
MPGLREDYQGVEMTFSLHFGALCKPISEQLKEQGITITDDESKRFQLIADAITLLHLHDIIPDSVTNKAHQKLMNKISKCVHEGDKP